jgi:hypothetical protein
VLTVGILVLLVSGAFAAWQVKPGGKAGQFPPPPAAARVWRSQTTGKEYRVWIENERLHAVWTNVPAELVQGGAYIRTECQRVGTRWIGSSQTYLPFPCGTTQNRNHVGKWCHVLTKIEFRRVEVDRITGSAEGYRRFDCESCKIVESVMKDFEWVPKEQSPVSSKQ